MKKSELEKENQELRELLTKKDKVIATQQQWIYNVCETIGKSNKSLEGIDSYICDDCDAVNYPKCKNCIGC